MTFDNSTSQIWSGLETNQYCDFMDIKSINEHSPWWARTFAIFLGIMLFFTVANLFYIEVFGINGINPYSFGNEPIYPGDYPENGTSEEQRDYNYSLDEWENYEAYNQMMEELEDSNLTEVTQIFAILSILVGIPAIAMFWTQNEKMLQLGIAYGAISTIGEIWKAYISSDIVASFMESFPGGAEYSWIAKISVLTSGICGIVFIALAIVLHNMYHSLNTMPESGFHLKVDNPAPSNSKHGDNDF